MWPFLVGVAVGFLSSMPPIGPGALLLMRRGLEGRMQAGLAAAAGGACADAIYCALAVVGFSFLLWKHPDIAASMRWIGVAILISVGLWFLSRKPQSIAPNGSPGNGDWPHHLLLGFSLTAFNPMLLVTWTTGVAIVASAGSGFFAGAGRYAFPLGVAIGDVAWAAVLLGSLRRLGRTLPDRWVAKLTRSVGAALLAVALFFAIRLVL